MQLGEASFIGEILDNHAPMLQQNEIIPLRYDRPHIGGDMHWTSSAFNREVIHCRVTHVDPSSSQFDLRRNAADTHHYGRGEYDLANTVI